MLVNNILQNVQVGELIFKHIYSIYPTYLDKGQNRVKSVNLVIDQIFFKGKMATL